MTAETDKRLLNTKDPAHDPEVCVYCEYSAYDQFECDDCKGTGGTLEEPCEDCDGHGFGGHSW